MREVRSPTEVSGDFTRHDAGPGLVSARKIWSSIAPVRRPSTSISRRPPSVDESKLTRCVSPPATVISTPSAGSIVSNLDALSADSSRRSHSARTIARTAVGCAGQGSVEAPPPDSRWIVQPPAGVRVTTEASLPAMGSTRIVSTCEGSSLRSEPASPVVVALVGAMSSATPTIERARTSRSEITMALRDMAPV